MKQCAVEFQSDCEQRFAQAEKGADLWSLFAASAGDGATRKPEKRRWWNKISESFEGIVSAIKAD
jgi:hypothetical protein